MAFDRAAKNAIKGFKNEEGKEDILLEMAMSEFSGKIHQFSRKSSHGAHFTLYGLSLWHFYWRRAARGQHNNLPISINRGFSFVPVQSILFVWTLRNFRLKFCADISNFSTISVDRFSFWCLIPSINSK